MVESSRSLEAAVFTGSGPHVDAAAVGNELPTAKGELMMQKVNHEIAIISVQRLVDVTVRR